MSDGVLFILGASSICSVVIKGESSISNVSFLSWAKVTSKFIDNISMMKLQIIL